MRKQLFYYNLFLTNNYSYINTIDYHDDYIKNRCYELSNSSTKALAFSYYYRAKNNYSILNNNNINNINNMIKGTKIHALAAKYALEDKNFMEQYCYENYQLEIESSFLLRKKVSHHVLGSSRPDLFNITTGEVFDYKTGNNFTSENTCRKLLKNLPIPFSNRITVYDISDLGFTKTFTKKLGYRLYD